MNAPEEIVGMLKWFQSYKRHMFSVKLNVLLAKIMQVSNNLSLVIIPINVYSKFCSKN